LVHRLYIAGKVAVQELSVAEHHVLSNSNSNSCCSCYGCYYEVL